MRRVELTSVGGTVAALAALLASSCCALPMALAFAGASTGVVGLLGPLHAVRPLILLAAGGLLVAAWSMALRRRSSGVYPLLVVATALLASSFFWQTWDPWVQRLVMRTLGP